MTALGAIAARTVRPARPGLRNEMRSEAAAEPAGAAPPTPAILTRPEVLHEGETVIVSIKPSIAYIFLGSLAHLVALALGAIAVLWLISIAWLPFAQGTVATVAGLLAAARLVWQFLDWLARDYILTDRRVIRVAGVLHRHTFETSLRTIQHLELSRTVPERLFGLGSLGFATAGTGLIEAWWLSIDRPHEIMDTVRKAIERYGRP